MYPEHMPSLKALQPYFGPSSNALPDLLRRFRTTMHSKQHSMDVASKRPVATHVRVMNLVPLIALTPMALPYLLMIWVALDARAVAMALAMPSARDANQLTETLRKALIRPEKKILIAEKRIAEPMKPIAMPARRWSASYSSYFLGRDD